MGRYMSIGLPGANTVAKSKVRGATPTIVTDASLRVTARPTIFGSEAKRRFTCRNSVIPREDRSICTHQRKMIGRVAETRRGKRKSFEKPADCSGAPILRL